MSVLPKPCSMNQPTPSLALGKSRGSGDLKPGSSWLTVVDSPQTARKLGNDLSTHGMRSVGDTVAENSFRQIEDGHFFESSAMPCFIAFAFELDFDNRFFRSLFFGRYTPPFGSPFKAAHRLQFR